MVQDAVRRIESDDESSARSTTTIGCLFMDSTAGPQFSGFDATIWAGIARTVVERGAQVLLLNPECASSAEAFAGFVRRRGVDALAVRLDRSAGGLLDIVAASGVPAVVVAHKHDHPDVGYAIVRSRETSCSAVEHLLHLGHRRIAFCENTVRDHDHDDRRAGYLDALRLHGIEPDGDLMITVPADTRGGIAAINRLVPMPDPPTAVYFADPLPTLGALRRLHELGTSVPGEFSVVGFDDDSARLLGYPVFTAVCQDAPQLGVATARALVRSLRTGSGARPPRVELESFLDVNATTGRAPAAHAPGVSSARDVAVQG